MSLPRQYARTRRFSLGVARDFTVSPDGGRIVFLRSRAGNDPATGLWTFDVSSGAERAVFEPPAGPEELTPEERTRRERVREQATGVTDYATDASLRRVAFALSGRLWTVDLGPVGPGPADLGSDDRGPVDPGAADLGSDDRGPVDPGPADLGSSDLGSDGLGSGDLGVGGLGVGGRGGGVPRELSVSGPVADPRLDPTGSSIAYVTGGALHVVGVDGSGDVALAVPEGPEVTYGLPEHVAAESMGRHRGYWWSPDGTRILVARVDNGPVQRWYISDPSDPGAPPAEIAYPSVGTANADVSLWIVDVAGGRRVAVDWDRTAFEYVVTASWTAEEPMVVVQSRDQRTLRLLSVDPSTGATSLLRENTDPRWVTIVHGVPALTGTGALVWSADEDGARRLFVGDEPVTPPSMNLREVLDVDGETVLLSVSREPTGVEIWTYSPGTGLRPFADTPGVHRARRNGGTTVLVSQSLDHDGRIVSVHRHGERVGVLTSHAEKPVLTPRVEILRVGEHEVRTAVVLPSWHRPGAERLPVLVDSYGGPGAQRVLSARDGYLVSQWFADRGFAVVITDGRGTPGRGPAWERSIFGDLADPVLEDQIVALHAAAERHDDLDLGRVAIRGWSFGGYLAALAVLRRPEIFHAAVAGAPVTDHRLYDTHYKERYLGHPAEQPQAYEQCCLLPDAPNLRRPLMLVHGLADDNVVVAHTLRLSAALTAAGRPHTVLPLPGVTHMTPQEDVAENLLLLQARFLKEALGTDQ